MLVALLVGCSEASKPDSGEAAEDTAASDTQETGDSGDTAETGDTGDTGDTGETGDTGAAVPVVWEGEEAEGIGWGILVGDDLDGAGTRGVVAAAIGADAVQLRHVSGAVIGSVALDGAAWLQDLGDGGVAALAWNEEDADVYLLDGPLLGIADAETGARAIVRGLDAESVQFGLGEGGGDATGDGAWDVLAIDGYDVRLFDGGALAGEQGPSSAVATFAGSDHPTVSLLGDLDADGVADVVVSRGVFGDGASVYRGPVAGALTDAEADLAVVADRGTCWLLLAAGDVDGDGRPELACDVDMTDVVLFPAAADGQVGVDDGVARVSPGGEMAWVAAIDADLDGDARADLVLGEPTYDDIAGRFGVLHGPLLGTLGPPTWLAVGPAGATLGNTLATGDIDGDGLADAVATAPAYDSWAGALYLVFGGR